MKSPPKQADAALVGLRESLAAWFRRQRRSLPWREPRSLYRTVVSEFMLQQTQVATVRPFFERWMEKLPDFEALAAADEETVLKLWEGLGYYRRARFLHRLAREILARGEPPQTAAGWRELPGVGPYTAAAIASLAFSDPVACVDGNVVRILARLTGETRVFADPALAVRHFTSMAAALLDRSRPGEHNEAMMELGATVCLRRRPLCTTCPWFQPCAGRRLGIAEELPRLQRRATEAREIDRAWVITGGALLLHRIPAQAARMSGLFELPEAAQAGFSTDELTPRRLIATHRRSITRFRITERIFDLSNAAARIAETPAELSWVALGDLPTITLSGPHRRWVESLLRDRSSAAAEADPDPGPARAPARSCGRSAGRRGDGGEGLFEKHA